MIAYGSENWIGAGYTMLAVVANRRGDGETARENAMLGLERYTAANYTWGRASSLNELAMAYHLLGRFEEARRYQEESIAIKRQVSAHGSLALSLSDLAATTVAQGEFATALTTIQECLRTLEPSGDYGRFPRLFGVAAQIMLSRGDRGAAISSLATMLFLTRARDLNFGEREAHSSLSDLTEEARLAPTPPIEAIAKLILAM